MPIVYVEVKVHFKEDHEQVEQLSNLSDDITVWQHSQLDDLVNRS